MYNQLIWPLALLCIVCEALDVGSFSEVKRLHRRIHSKSRSQDNDIAKPKVDPREFQHGLLRNGLRVLTIHDPRAVKASFAMAVSAGSFYDPPELPGLAHFCEHLLFLGTEKYPDESSFDNFMAENDGSSNAYTDNERTVFYGEVAQSGLREGIDRFAQFFIGPLFRDALVGRELNAVNSEHEKNMPNLGYQLWELLRGTAGEDSVLSKFGTGTTESLSHGDASTVEALKQYHRENYCAPRMSLVIAANLTCDGMMNLARNHFAHVPTGAADNGDIYCFPDPQDFSADQHFTKPNSLGRLIELPTDSVPQLWMMFPLPVTLRNYRAQPLQVLDHLLGYRGEGSLRSVLRAAGLISDVWVEAEQSTAATLLFLSFDLTSKGATTPEMITGTTFQYLLRLQQLRTSEQALLTESYSKMQTLSRALFDYNEPEASSMDIVCDLAAAMQIYAPKDVLAGELRIDDMNNNLISDILAALRPDNVNLALATTKAGQGRVPNSRNQWYKIDYFDGTAPPTMLSQAMPQSMDRGSDCPTCLQLPPPMRFVPKNLDILADSVHSQRPRFASVEHGTDLQSEAWWIGQRHMTTPKAWVNIQLLPPKEMSGTAKFEALRRLHAELAQQLLEETIAEMGDCGASWYIQATRDGYEISLSGFSEHMEILVQSSALAISQKYQGTAIFNSRENLLDQLEDPSYLQPYEHASDALSIFATNSAFTRSEVAAEIQPLTEEDLKEYYSMLCQRGLRVKLLGAGNLNLGGTKQLVKSLVRGLGLQKTVGVDDAATSLVRKVQGPVVVRMPNPIQGDQDSALVVAYQYGNPDVAQRVKLLLLSQMISQPIYDTLRTQQQLGYVVSGYVASRLDTLELRVVVQGSAASPDEVDTRVEKVLDDFGANLEALTEEDFVSWKASLRTDLEELPETVSGQADKVWSHVLADNTCFEWQKLAFKYLDSLTSSGDLLREFQTLRDNQRKISVRLYGKQEWSKLLKVQGEQTSKNTETYGTMVVEAPKAQPVAPGEDYWPVGRSCKLHD
mmetsp:Transcript_19660/g.42988  ORF Transcript_19660/g.42988 Transcript_19660/m.42988 type:complete len:1022 (-) Transcript_19660:90-3155(-)